MATNHQNRNRRQDRIDLMRLLHGELAPAHAERLRRRLESEPELAAALRRMEVTWELLDLPPVAPAPPGFARQVASRAGQERRAGAETAPFRPAWARAMAAAALAAGIVAGAAVGWLVIPPETVAGSSATAISSAGSASTAGASVASSTASPSAAQGTADRAETPSESETLDTLSTDSLPSLAESYWSAFAPDGKTAQTGQIGEGGTSREGIR